MILRPDVPMIKPVKMHANVGACLDIPTGNFVKGKYGESLLKGGVPAFLVLVVKPITSSPRFWLDALGSPVPFDQTCSFFVLV